MPEDSDNETIPDLCCPKCHQQDLRVLLGILGLMYYLNVLFKFILILSIWMTTTLLLADPWQIDQDENFITLKKMVKSNMEITSTLILIRIMVVVLMFFSSSTLCRITHYL